MKLKKSVLALAGAAALMSSQALSADDKLTLGISQYPSTLHPIIDSMVAKTYTHGFTFRDTIGFDQQWKLMCFLCEEVPSFENGLAVVVDRPHAKEGESEKGVKITVKFKKDLFWGDGTPITTKDVKFWYDVATSSEVQGNAGLSTYQHMEKLEVVDDYTVNVYVDRVSYKYNAYYIPSVLPRHVEESIFNANPKEYHLKTKYVTDPTNAALYNGPYTIKNLKQGQFVILGLNEHWKGKQPHFGNITIKTVSDTQALQANLLSGDVDYIPGEMGLTLDQALQFEKKFGNKYDVDIRPAALYEHLDVQLQNEHLQDVRVRQALLFGLDRELLTKKLFAGKQKVANSNVSPLDASFDPNAPSYSYDPEKAKALLKEAGYKLVNGVQMKNGKPLEIEFMTTSGNKTRELVQQFAQGQWKKVGIKTIINNQTARVYFGTTLNQRQHKGLAMFAWGSSPEQLPRTTLHSEYIPTKENGWSGQNYAGYKNPKMDELINKIDEELNFEKRMELWKEFQNLYATELPALPLYYRSDSYIKPKWLKGIAPTGHQNYSSYWAENWTREK
ncbi:putative ABC-type dipeptide transport system,periplasmic component [Vibrio nigripulchritudo SFn27]|uniref:ABC-type dipeptide transport system,periplasmic component n=2 Tax=Vibrio nigripulchritudo TaxID=28173 RepID=A0AAV2VM75_9VIBR|nr:peptide ABC transporter substrate-binding protein [Vibrio nigripulchritudo]CCN81472.1 putative ABC-type dipeptide transport system,periplasmic component [Vibrio nigripulchritudo BLFn1]CCN91568.1 putative ABC-type dipeptide transport system,periplasmic component [Vibrio nigripulchritudo SFn27]CCN96453.1 putative ABC-type dipeptide transport system,periplasmic component [Vibrio nigripulchritudo ENn2]CCO38326.1 putative ABC-type dipeptide transport system,periplasmic component [Vibrio nigripulc